MSLSNDDIKTMSELLDVKLEHHIGKLELRCQKHEQTIYGINNDNGLNGEIKNLKKRVLRLEIFTSVVQGAVAALVIFKEKIFH